MHKSAPVALSAFAIATLFLAPTAALAHATLVASTPAADTRVAKVTTIRLEFNEKLTPSTASAELVMTAMPGMADHPPMKIAVTTAMGKDGMSMILTPKRALVPGTYKVQWAGAGPDAHAVRGDYSFTVK